MMIFNITLCDPGDLDISTRLIFAQRMREYSPVLVTVLNLGADGGPTLDWDDNTSNLEQLPASNQPCKC